MNKLLHLLYLGVSYKLKLLKPLNPPYQFSIEPTNFCNFRCVFCPQSAPGHKLSRKKGFLSVENMRLFLKEIHKVSPGNNTISLTLDGEPTLNKSFPEFIRLINSEGFFPRFSSNAKNLVPEMVDELASAGDFLASIDFASDAKYYENIRGREGDFRVVLENLRYMAGIASKNRRIKLEISNISHYSGADPKETLKEMRFLFPTHLRRNISFWAREFHNFCGHLKSNRHDDYLLCPYPWTSFDVTWNGDVVPCCRDTQASTVLGNVFKDSITDIWNGEKYQELRRKLVQKDVAGIAACKKCDLPWTAGRRRKFKYMISSLLRR